MGFDQKTNRGLQLVEANVGKMATKTDSAVFSLLSNVSNMIDYISIPMTLEWCSVSSVQAQAAVMGDRDLGHRFQPHIVLIED